jgi:hypothetical protein
LFRKEQLQKQREYLKKKKQKKQVKMKEMEEAREAEKSKWQAFNAKVWNRIKYFIIYFMKLCSIELVTFTVSFFIDPL